MKKRLISLLLAIGVVVGMLFGMIPQASACNLPDYSDTDDRVEAVFCHAKLEEDCYVRKNPYEHRDEDPYLKKGVEVWVICMVVDQGNFVYKVSIEKMEISGYIPCDSATLLHDHEECVPNEEEHDCAAGYDSPEAEREAEKEEINWVTVKKAGKIAKDGGAIVRIDIYNPDAEKDPMLNEGCNVWVKRSGFYEGEYWYHISVGEPAEYYVRARFVTLKEEKPEKAEPKQPSSVETEPKKEIHAKKEEAEQITVAEKVDVVAKQGKVSTPDRYIIFTTQGCVKHRGYNLNRSAFQELHMF